MTAIKKKLKVSGGNGGVPPVIGRTVSVLASHWSKKNPTWIAWPSTLLPQSIVPFIPYGYVKVGRQPCGVQEKAHLARTPLDTSPNL